MEDDICIFCGKKVDNYTVEHVFPKWLIKLTGEKNRKIRFNFFGSNHVIEKNINDFHYPACLRCNSTFGKTEEKTAKVMKKILDNQSVTTDEIDTLLTWFDKVRTGLWSAINYEVSNKYKIQQHFFINDRTTLKDRMLIINKLTNVKKGLGVIGNITPVFRYMPSACQFLINNYLFTTISTDFLCSRQLGMPFLDENNKIKEFARIMPQILPKMPIVEDSIIFYQPIGALLDIEYVSEYSRAHSYDYKKAIGGIFEQVPNRKTVFLPKGKNLNLDLTPIVFDLSDQFKRIVEIQNIAFKIGSKWGGTSNNLIQYNNEFIKNLLKLRLF